MRSTVVLAVECKELERKAANNGWVADVSLDDEQCDDTGDNSMGRD